jgi:hypothetical protein
LIVVVIVMLVAHRGPDPWIARDFLEEKDQDHDDQPGPQSR